jgi:hypothetical protein
MMCASFPRRRALQVLGAAVLAGSAGRLLSSTRNQALIENGGPVLADFTAVSTILTGKADADPALALALYHALREATPGFDAALPALRAALEQGTGHGMDGRLAFGEEGKPQLALSQAILQAWFLGVAGKGARATCVAYVDALANRAVAATLAPPSYSYGALGTWQARP